MVKTMKRGVSLLFVISLLASMLMISAEATNGSKSATVASTGTSVKYVSIYTDKSGKTTTVTVKNTSKTRHIALYKNMGSVGYAYAGDLYPGRSMSFSAKADGKTYSFMLQRAGGSGSATVNFTIKNGH